MAFDDANQILAGPRSAIAKFDRIGDSITGVLVDAEVQPVTNPQGEVQVDKNGNVKKQIIYTLQTDQRDPEIEDDDGKRRVFAKWAIQKAISEFLAENGLSAVGLQEGGILTVTHTETKKSTTRGYNDTKLYTATYQPPPPRQLPTGTSGTPTPASNDEGPWAPSAPAAPKEMQDLAWQIYEADKNTPLAVISAATRISEDELRSMFTPV